MKLLPFVGTLAPAEFQRSPSPLCSQMPMTQKFMNFVTGTFDFSRADYRRFSRARPEFSRAFFQKFSRASWKIHGHFEK